MKLKFFKPALLYIACMLFSGNNLFSAVTDSLVISEFMAINSTVLQDEDGDYSDWIEIYNPGTDTVDLLAWSLTDRIYESNKWVFPQILLPPDSYLIVFASGKDRRNPANNLHTNFKLSGSGEYLGLYKPGGLTVSYSFSPEFPEQYEDISYGEYSGDIIYFSTPTPGASNSGDEFLNPPEFSVSRGFYYSPFSVELSSASQGSQIYYTTNGGTPSEDNGTLYTAPVSITTTTTLRAVTVKAGLVPSASVTHTYIFTADVVNQPDDPAGYPSEWGSYYDFEGTAIADYGMDPEVTDNPEYSGLFDSSLLSVPAISLVTDIDFLFSHSTDPDSGGIYIYTGADGSLGDGWERPASFEYIIPNTEESIQVNCGLRIQGGASRRAEKSPKHSFRLLFRSIYGPGRFNYPLFGDSATDEFNTIVFRSAYGNSWRHFDPNQRARAQHIRDPWSKDTQLDMGQISAHNKFAHLYLNGLYWGLYNISERYDKAFMESYYGGDEEEFDILKDYGELVDGNRDAWNYLHNAVNSSSITDNAFYQKLIGNSPNGIPNPSYPSYVDPVNLIDYMLLNFYGGNNDWDHHNWVAARNRINPDKGFQFYCWDTEKILEDKYENYVNEDNSGRPSRIFRRLMTNEEFRILFADRVNLHLRNNGLLCPDSCIRRYMERADEIEVAMISESARWGDYRRDVHQWWWGPYYLYTRNDYWYDEQDRLVYDYFPDRTGLLLDFLWDAGMVPSIDPPTFNQYGGHVTEDFRLEINTPNGDIYYTVNGSDPRLIGGSISGNAVHYTGSFIVPGKVIPVKARAKDGSEWSGLTEATFYNDYFMSDKQVFAQDLSGISIYPNPFRDYTTISYNLPESGNVEISVFTTEGMLVAKILDDYHMRGENTFLWRPDNLRAGVYFIKIISGDYNANSKLIYMK
jgi:hypothetical protein